MNIAYLTSHWSGFRQKRNGERKGKRNNGRVPPESLEKDYCTEDIRTEYNSLISKIDFNKIHPIVYSLLNIEWSIFGSLTWENPEYRRDTPASERLRFKDFNLLIRRTCQLLHLDKDEIQFYVTSERGDSCECHLHFLIARDGLTGVPDSIVCLTQNHLWANNLQLTTNRIESNRNMGEHKGVAKIEPFDQKRHIEGVIYVCKREIDFVSGREYPAVYHLSNALKRRAGKINSALEKPPPISSSQGKSIKKYFCSVAVHRASISDLKVVPSFPRFIVLKKVWGTTKDRDCFRTRDPPPLCSRDGRTVYEKIQNGTFLNNVSGIPVNSF